MSGEVVKVKTVDDVKKRVCTWINSLDVEVQAIVTPTSHEAPAGRYIAVRDLGVNQFGRPLKAEPGTVANENDTHFIYTVDLVITEVEGEGDKLREIRALMQLPPFRDYASEQGFTLWSIGDIVNNDMADGEFWIRQKAFNVTVNFVGSVKYSAVRAQSAGIAVNGNDEFEVTINQ